MKSDTFPAIITPLQDLLGKAKTKRPEKKRATWLQPTTGTKTTSGPQPTSTEKPENSRISPENLTLVLTTLLSNNMKI